MRALLLLAPALMLGACQVTEDKANGQTTVSYNQDVAENAGASALNTVDKAATSIANDAKEVASDVRNVDVDVKVDTKGDAPPANSN